tara:strand:+ start:698 stop:1114 length:417 start_codon:yes stop_codon:yes gene_type:complete
MTVHSIAFSVRVFLINNGENVRLPYIWEFPRNCCESASFLLAECILIFHPQSEVYIVRSRKGSENHIWVEVEGLVYDITLDQFHEFGEPVIGGDMASYHFQFTDCDRILYANEKRQNDWFPGMESEFKNVAERIFENA